MKYFHVIFFTIIDKLNLLKEDVQGGLLVELLKLQKMNLKFYIKSNILHSS
jgi:hypothetical protein